MNFTLDEITAVYRGLKWKKSDAFTAEKLGIELARYKEIKTHVSSTPTESSIIGDQDGVINLAHTSVDVDLDKGNKIINTVSSTQPQSVEDVMKLLKIDEKQWRLQKYKTWQMGEKWQISATIVMTNQTPAEQADTFLEKLKTIKFPEIKRLTKDEVLINQESSINVCGVLALQDIHYGKVNNEDIHDIVRDSVKSILGRAYASHNIEKLYFVIGGDMLNIDTFNGTTTKGTIVENTMTAPDTYMTAFTSMHEVIQIVAQYCELLEIVFIPGNHDRLSSFHLVHALSQAFSSEPSITFDTQYAERKVRVYGKNFFGFEHGDVNAKNNPLVYATEYSKEWGKTVHRTSFTGHYHSKRAKEFISENEDVGFTTKILPSLSSTDYYHYHNKWVNNKRSAVLELHHKEKGKISEFIYTV